MDGEDFEATKTMLEFKAEQPIACVAIPILDDCVLEELETFKIEMKKEDVEEEKLSRVNVVAGESVVRIMDEQSKCPQSLLRTLQSY